MTLMIGYVCTKCKEPCGSYRYDMLPDNVCPNCRKRDYTKCGMYIRRINFVGIYLKRRLYQDNRLKPYEGLKTTVFLFEDDSIMVSPEEGVQIIIKKFYNKGIVSKDTK